MRTTINSFEDQVCLFAHVSRWLIATWSHLRRKKRVDDIRKVVDRNMREMRVSTYSWIRERPFTFPEVLPLEPIIKMETINTEVLIEGKTANLVENTVRFTVPGSDKLKPWTKKKREWVAAA